MMAMEQQSNESLHCRRKPPGSQVAEKKAKLVCLACTRPGNLCKHSRNVVERLPALAAAPRVQRLSRIQEDRWVLPFALANLEGNGVIAGCLSAEIATGLMNPSKQHAGFSDQAVRLLQELGTDTSSFAQPAGQTDAVWEFFDQDKRIDTPGRKNALPECEQAWTRDPVALQAKQNACMAQLVGAGGVPPQPTPNSRDGPDFAPANEVSLASGTDAHLRLALELAHVRRQLGKVKPIRNPAL